MEEEEGSESGETPRLENRTWRDNGGRFRQYVLDTSWETDSVIWKSDSSCSSLKRGYLVYSSPADSVLQKFTAAGLPKDQGSKCGGGGGGDDGNIHSRLRMRPRPIDKEKTALRWMKEGTSITLYLAKWPRHAKHLKHY